MRLRVLLRVASTLLLAVAACGGDDAPGWSSSERLAEAVVGWDGVETDAEGNAVTVWAQADEVWAARLVRGRGWEAPTRISAPETMRFASNPSMAMNQVGQAVAVWREDTRDSDDQTDAGFWATTFDPSLGWAAPDYLGRYAGVPAVAMNNAGQAVVLGVAGGLSAIRYESDIGWGPGIRIDRDCDWGAFVAGGAEDLHIAMNDRGEAIAVWSGNGSAETNCADSWDSQVSRFAPGAGWTAPERLGLGFGVMNHAVLAMDESGRSLVGPVAYSESGRQTTIDYRLPPAAVAMSSQGEGLVVWRIHAGVAGTVLLASRFSPIEGWGSPETIGVSVLPFEERGARPKSPGIVDSLGVDLDVNDRGESLVVWRQARLEQESRYGWRFSVWSTRFAPTTGWTEPVPLSAEEDVDAYSPRVALDGRGGGIALWAEDPDGYAYGEPGSLVWSRLE